MDPLTVAVTTILGKYAIDKGATLIKEAGKAVSDVAGKIFQKVLDRLKADPAEAKNADRFEKDPQGYAKPIADAVADKVQADPQFAAELQALIEEFKHAGGTSIINVGRDNITINQDIDIDTNYGAITGYVGRSTTNRSGGTDIHATDVNIDGDVIGHDKNTN